PVVLVATFVLEQDGRAVVLGNEQVGGAVVVVVSGDDRARIFELNLVETHVGGDVLPSVRPKIAKEFDFAFALFRLTDSYQVHPAVVVVIEGGDAVGAGPTGFGEFDLLEGFAVIVAPEADGAVRMRKRQIHPTVVIEIKDGDACRSFRASLRPQARGSEWSLSCILKNYWICGELCHYEIDSAIIVIVRADRRDAYGC